jgi:hypothetical protein
MATFETTYTRTFNELNTAKAYYEKQNRRRQPLDLTVLSPKTFKTSLFANRLKMNVVQSIQMLYDTSQCYKGDLVKMVRILSGMQSTCQVYVDPVSHIEKAYFCNFHQTKTMLVPETADDYIKLFDVVTSLISGTELLNNVYVQTHKPTRAQIHLATNGVCSTWRKHVTNGNEAALGAFAAVLVWMLETPYMNRYHTAHNSVASSSDLNRESRILRKLAPPTMSNIPEQPVVSVEAQDTEPEPQTQPLKPLQGEDDDVVDSWEDLDF